MSRIGNNPITIEEGVDVKIEGKLVSVKGPKGDLTITLPNQIDASVEDGKVIVTRNSEAKLSKSMHGTFRMHIANAIEGVKNGFEKKLALVGVGYRAKLEGKTLVMTLGWNHPIKVEPYEGIEIEVPEETKIVIRGYDKQKVGEFAAKVRACRKPEPYKGKGVRYEGEYVRKKSSKSSVV